MEERYNKDAPADPYQLRDVGGKLGLHQHLCLFYNNHEEQLAAAVLFLRTGLDRGEGCLYMVDEDTATDTLEALRKEGTDIDRYRGSGALTVASRNRIFPGTQRFDPDRVVSFWIEAATRAEAEGFPQLRVLTEVTWACEEDTVPAGYMEFESKINHTVRGHKLTAVCLYNRARFVPEIILDVLRTHPTVVYGGLVARNPYYVPPEEFLQPNQPERKVDRLLKNILEWQRAEDELHQSNDRYKGFFSHSDEGFWRLELEQPIPIDLAEEESLQRILQFGYLAETNQAMARNWGISTPEELLGKRLGDVLALSDAGRMEAFRSAARSGWQNRTVEFQGFDRLGNLKYWRRTETPIVENGMLVRVWGITRDLTQLKQAEQSLHESAERFRITFENAGTGMALVDVQGYVVKSNPALQEMLGYSEEELGGVAFTEFTHPDDRALDWRLYQELFAGKREKYEIEKRYIRKDGRTIWGHLIVSVFRDADGTPQYAVGMAEDITERKQVEEELRNSRNKLRALAGRLQRVREEERTRVAREIHDELGQALTAVKLDLSSLTRELKAGQRERAKAVLKSVDETIQSVRRISTELRPAILDAAGLVAAVEWAAEEFEARSGTQCRFELPSGDVVIDPECATALFRIFQETLTNVARHADATRVQVRLAQGDNATVLDVRDNGKGVSEEQLSAGSSLGVLGMRERARLLGGELSISGEAGKGTTVTVRIPRGRPAPPEDHL